MQKTGAKVANPTLSSLTASDLERSPYAKSMRPAALSSELADQIAAGDHVPLINLASFYSARL
jgi:hypothetical protein